MISATENVVKQLQFLKAVVEDRHIVLQALYDFRTMEYDGIDASNTTSVETIKSLTNIIKLLKDLPD